MAIDRQIFTFMPHTVTITSYVSKNNYGEDVTVLEEPVTSSP